MQPVIRARNFALQVVDFASRHSEQARRDARNVDLCLSALCKPDLLAEIRFPVAYIDLLRTCVEHAHCSVEEVKSASSTGDRAERFTTLLSTLRSAVPPLDFHVATAIAALADHYRSSRQPLESAIAGDVGHHFDVSSSFGKRAGF